MMAQATYDSAIIFIICYQPAVDNEYPLLDSDGNPADMWTSSITAFTALMFVVMANLFTRMKYITWLHHLSIWALSLAIYLIWMWISNWMPPQTEYAVMAAHRSYRVIGLPVSILRSLAVSERVSSATMLSTAGRYLSKRILLTTLEL